MTVVAIIQSNYIPWRGYFDIIRNADRFVFYDTVQFTKNDWRNRNRLVGPSGAFWLTLPVRTSGLFGQTITQTEISDANWTTRHLSVLRAAFAKAPQGRKWLMPLLEQWLASLSAETSLSRVNQFLIREIMCQLGITTQLHDAVSIPQLGDRTGRLVSICQHLGGRVYLSGPSGRAYLDESQFESAGIKVEWMNYPEYPAYKQMDGGYDPKVSIIDVLASMPPNRVFE